MNKIASLEHLRKTVLELMYRVEDQSGRRPDVLGCAPEMQADMEKVLPQGVKLRVDPDCNENQFYLSHGPIEFP